MGKLIRVGTRESQLATWQASLVQQLLEKNGFAAELVFIKSEGDLDLQTPLYEMGVQGIFTRSLDQALIANRIDIAVHSMKDVPVQLARGVAQAAVLERASHKDIFVFRDHAFVDNWRLDDPLYIASRDQVPGGVIATSSIRRKAQWLNRYPNHRVENLRGNVNTRLRKLGEHGWDGAIFAAAGLERIDLRPVNSLDLDWMLPAPAQGAIMVACREDDHYCLEACRHFNDSATALCTKLERDFLKTLLGGCSTPISALALIKEQQVYFRGNVLSVDGKEKVQVEKTAGLERSARIGYEAATELLHKGANAIVSPLEHGD